MDRIGRMGLPNLVFMVARDSRLPRPGAMRDT